MLGKHSHENTERVPFVVGLFRVMHCALFCYAAAIVGLAFFLDSADSGVGIASQRGFSLVVATPILLGSFCFWLAVTARVLFGLAIFYCFFLTFLLAMLPAMANVFFPDHLYLFGLGALFALSGIVLIRYFFAQPIRKRKWDDSSSRG